MFILKGILFVSAVLVSFVALVALAYWISAEVRRLVCLILVTLVLSASQMGLAMEGGSSTILNVICYAVGGLTLASAVGGMMRNIE